MGQRLHTWQWLPALLSFLFPLEKANSSSPFLLPIVTLAASTFALLFLQRSCNCLNLWVLDCSTLDKQNQLRDLRFQSFGRLMQPRKAHWITQLSTTTRFVCQLITDWFNLKIQAGHQHTADWIAFSKLHSWLEGQSLSVTSTPESLF